MSAFEDEIDLCGSKLGSFKPVSIFTCRLKCASKWGFFWRRPSYHSHLEPLHFPIWLGSIYLEDKADVFRSI